MVAAFEVRKGVYEVARRERGVDIDVYFDCALQACSRLGGAAPAGWRSRSRCCKPSLHGETALLHD
ncbi:hypothetical protein ACFQLX_22350 [Streptomyces polyrhachis]|uniref:Uncharacterized protein n=1 Tax=Streptomyces polyrhachis TaxID=1282885 RepID=A0ABW2GMT1_9ACTN